MAERRSVAADVLGSNPSSRPKLLSIEPARWRTSSGSEPILIRSTLIYSTLIHFSLPNSSLPNSSLPYTYKTSLSLAVVPVLAADAVSADESKVVSACAAKAGKR